MTNKPKHQLAILGTAMVLTVPNAAWRAWLFSYLWTWFVTPVFGVAVPALWTLAGLLLIVSYFRSSSAETFSDWPSALGSMVGKGFVAPAIWFFVGWVIAKLAGVA